MYPLFQIPFGTLSFSNYLFRFFKAGRLAIAMAFVLLIFGVADARRPKMTQESNRRLGEPTGTGQVATNEKYLSPGNVDGWLFDAVENEVLIVEVTTQQFDAVLGLGLINREAAGEEEVLFSVDKEGSNSKFCYRIKKPGRYKIRVHGFEMKGGGNYALQVQRYAAKPIALGEKVHALLGKQGTASYFFEGKIDEDFLLTFDRRCTVLNRRGDVVPFHWKRALRILEDGEHVVVLNGIAGQSVSGEIYRAKQSTLNFGESETQKLGREDLQIWDIHADAGEFQVIEVSRSAAHKTRFIFAPRIGSNDQSLETNNSGAAMNFLPVSSKGDRDVFAVSFLKAGRFQVQTYSTGPHKVTIESGNPTIEIEKSHAQDGTLEVGGVAIYGFHAKAGDVFEAKLESKHFDSVLALYARNGDRIEINDDYKDSRNSQITRVIRRTGYYRWHASSLGYGGGGEYQFQINEVPKKELAVGKTESSKIALGASEFWTLPCLKEQSVIINLKTDYFRPQVTVYDSKGLMVGTALSPSYDRRMFSIDVQPSRSPYTVWVQGEKGERGAYDIRVLDANWDG